MPNVSIPTGESPDSEPRLLTTLRDGLPELVDTPERLNDAIIALSNSSRPVGIDTERAQGYRYGSGAWLVQLRRSDVGTFLIDPRPLPDLTSLGRELDSTWILHAADQDLVALAELGMAPKRIFDTEIAARLLGFDRFSLRAVCERVLDVTLEKAHQNENWSVRPLPADWLRYAAMDVELLPELHERMEQQLRTAGRWEWAREEFEHERTHPIVVRENRWENLKGIGRLRTQKQLAIARELWRRRESLAQETDLAPTRILSNQGIIDAALADPHTRRQLISLPEFRRPRPRQYRDEWWNALRRVQGLTAAEMPSRHDLDPDPNEVPALRHWKKNRPHAVQRLNALREIVASTAKPLQIDPEILLLPRLQRHLAWTPLSGGSEQYAREELQQRLIAGEARRWQRDLLEEAFEEHPNLVQAMTQPD